MVEQEGNESSERRLKPIPEKVGLDILYASASHDPENPNQADLMLCQYETDTTILDKIPRFFLDQEGHLAYWSEHKKPMGFILPKNEEDD